MNSLTPSRFAPINLHPHPTIPGYDDLISRLADADKPRVEFLKACLTKLGLEVSQHDSGIPSLSRLHISSIDDTGVSELLADWADIIDKEEGEEWIRAETDTFHIQNEGTIWSVEGLQQSLAETNGSSMSENGIIDYTKVIKKIFPHEKGHPHPKLTPQFNHGLYFSGLKRYRQIEPTAQDWGNLLMYGEVLTSTNTILEKYVAVYPCTIYQSMLIMPETPSSCQSSQLVSQLPQLLRLLAEVVETMSGLHPLGCSSTPSSSIIPPTSPSLALWCLSSTLPPWPWLKLSSRTTAAMRTSLSSSSGPTTFVSQTRSITISILTGVDALDPTKSADKPHYVKVGGILSQCLYFDGAYQIILGIGLNTTNPRPTMSISDLVPPGAPELHLETLLARVLTRLEAIYAQFLREGFSRDLEARYYRHWLHTGQAVTLEAEGGVKARVLGITRDWGMLRAEETDASGRATGKIWTLQSDENSFDYWKGLVRRKT
jgi:biotin--protein ligase